MVIYFFLVIHIRRNGVEEDINIDEFMEYVSQVDAAPGLLEGDVSKDG